MQNKYLLNKLPFELGKVADHLKNECVGLLLVPKPGSDHQSLLGSFFLKKKIGSVGLGGAHKSVFFKSSLGDAKPCWKPLN